jgi:hypothetical protein
VSRSYFRRESSWQFAVEALLFAIIVVIAAWPIVNAAHALNEFLQRVPN